MRLLLILFSFFAFNCYAEFLPQIDNLDRGVFLSEEDGSPSLLDVSEITVSNTTLTDDGDTTATLDTSGTQTTGWTDDGTIVRLTTIFDNVGIGTTDPGEKLVIGGDGDKLAFGAAEDYDIEWDGDDAVHTITAGDFVFTGGNVGIGVTATISKLHIVGAATGAATVFHVENTAQNLFLGFFQGLAPNMRDGQSFAFTWGKRASNRERAFCEYVHVGTNNVLNRISFGFFGQANLLNILASGDIGMGGITDPDEKLEVSGNIHLTSDGDYISFGVAGATDYKIEWDSSDAVHTITAGDFVFTGGNVGIGTTGPSTALEVVGTVTATTFVGDIPINLGSGSPTVDEIKTYIDNTGSSGFFIGGELTDGGAGTLNVAAGSGFIRTTNDANAPLLSFKWSASSGIAVSDDTTQYVYVDDDGVISLSTDEFLERPDKIQIGVVTDEGGSSIHSFQLGVSLEESIAAAGRFIRRVHGITRNNRLGGLIFGQSGDVNRDVTMTAGELEWGRTTYVITSFDTTGAGDTFATYSAGGQEAAAASQWPNDEYDNSGTLTSVPNNKYANLFFYIEPDDHIVMIYGRAYFNSADLAQLEGVPNTSLPSRVTETSILAARFTFKEGVNTAVISSAFDTLFANAEVTDHSGLANLAWVNAGHNDSVLNINQNSDNKIGVGYTAPTSYLTMSGSLGIGVTGGTSRFLLIAASDGGAIIEGNVGIGTTAPISILQVIGNVAIGTTTPVSELVVVGTIHATTKYSGPADPIKIVVELPTADDAFLLEKAKFAYNLTNINCIVDPADSGESVAIDIQECNATGDSCSTVDASITCDNDGAADDGAFTNGTIDAGDWIYLDIGTTSGTVNWLTITIDRRIDQ